MPGHVNTQEAIELASEHLTGLNGHVFDVLTISKPVSIEAAIFLSKVVSKLSPIIGNFIEFNTVEYLNTVEEFEPFGSWIRQDPGFPDALFNGTIDPAPGFDGRGFPYPLTALDTIDEDLDGALETCSELLSFPGVG